MIDLTRSNSDYSVAEYLESLPNETDGDGECLFRIVPVLYAQDGELEWVEQTHYGATNEERAKAIVAEWVAKGAGRPEWDDLWFVTRRVLETSRR